MHGSLSEQIRGIPQSEEIEERVKSPDERTKAGKHEVRLGRSF